MDRAELRQIAQQQATESYKAARAKTEVQSGVFPGAGLTPGAVQVGKRDPQRGVTTCVYPSGGIGGAKLLYNASVPEGGIIKAQMAPGARPTLDTRSAQKTLPIASESASNGDIKYFFFDGHRYYVGGFKPNPVPVEGINGRVVSASIDNLGGNKWRLDIVSRSGSNLIVQAINPFAKKDNWSLTVPVPSLISEGNFLGFGFIFLFSNSVYLYNNPLPNPPDRISGSVSSAIETTFAYVLDGKLIKTSGKKTFLYTYSNNFLEDGAFDTHQSSSSKENATYYLLPTLPFKYTADSLATISEHFVPNVEFTRIDSVANSVSDAQSYRLNQGRSVGIGIRRTSTTQNSTVVDHTYASWLEGSIQPSSVEDFDFESYYLDVQKNSFTRFPKVVNSSDLIQPDGASLREVKVETFNKKFQRSKVEKVRMYGPNSPSANFRAYAASYHP
ncbi:MAG: hypothetical protein WCA35_15535 [Kovacikia sp.]